MTEEPRKEVIDKMMKAAKVWEAEFGLERTKFIIQKTASVRFIEEHTVLELVEVGEKWHYANLLFTGKITNEEFKKKFPK